MTPGNTLPSTDAPPWLRPRAAYVHVPFCAHHCGYCDFAIAVGHDDLIDRYLDALAAELATLGSPRPVETLYIGGGTPTHLDTRQLERLAGMVLLWLPPRAGHEFTIEANPGTLDDEKVRVLAAHGVTRISLGAQSFHRDTLAMLDRNHEPADVPRAVGCIRRHIGQVSLDLIFGAPQQTLADWENDLRWALSQRPDHLSTYGLTYEKGTPLWQRRQRGDFVPLDEESELAMYACALDTLAAAGFEHYEISNFARPGCRSRHNQVYWANEAYFGFGMGAARYVNGRRETNTRDLRTYIRKALAGEPAAFQSEELPADERARETMAVQLRRMDGIQREQFHRQTGMDLETVAGPMIARQVELGLLDDNGRRVCLTRQGKYLADAVIAELMR